MILRMKVSRITVNNTYRIIFSIFDSIKAVRSFPIFLDLWFVEPIKMFMILVISWASATETPEINHSLRGYFWICHLFAIKKGFFSLCLVNLWVSSQYQKIPEKSWCDLKYSSVRRWRHYLRDPQPEDVELVHKFKNKFRKFSFRKKIKFLRILLCVSFQRIKLVFR